MKPIMKVVLTAINSKYIHSNLAVRYIKEYGKKYYGYDFNILETTINNRLDYIFNKIAKQKPDVLAISCYIWNIETALAVAGEIKKIYPDCKIILGGPEVSFDSKSVIEKNSFVDFVLSGEGEKAFCELIKALESDNSDLAAVPNLTFKKDGEIKINEQAPLLSLDDIPFPYDDFKSLSNQIVYYETSRGCPFSCKYCLSSVSRCVRFLSKERFYIDLQKFLDARVRQVKFVDRTFNVNLNHTMEIFKYINEHDNGITNFHFEISAHLLNEEVLDYIKNVRPGLFQFEIGVQSTNDKTIAEVNRQTDFMKLSSVVNQINSYKNIHQHLDLIAGLPFEGYESFGKSFDDVYRLKPEQLQLGFLKVLQGSKMYDEAEKYGINYRSYPPYEVLKTNWLTFEEILRLKNVEEMVEVYYNSFRFQNSIEYAVSLFSSPFKFFETLGDYYELNGYNERSLSKLDYYDLLYKFIADSSGKNNEKLLYLFLLDIYSWEKANKLPSCINVGLSKNYRGEILAFYENEQNISAYLPEYKGIDPKLIARTAHIEILPFDENGEPIITSYLMNYKKRDITGKATVTKISI